MKNRAKCRLCQSIIESFHIHDYVTCKCGQISISGGNDHLFTQAINYSNFLRVDDQGNEIVVQVVDKDTNRFEKQEIEDDKIIQKEDKKKLTKAEILDTVNHLIKVYDGMPDISMNSPMTQYDHYSILILISSILSAEEL